MISAKLKRNTYSDDDVKHWGSRKACMELLWCSPATERTLLRLCVATAAVHDIKTRRNAGQEKDDHGEPLETVEIRDCVSSPQRCTLPVHAFCWRMSSFLLQ